jgi:hypothetical protein
MQDRCSEYFKGLVLLGGYALGLKLSRQPASASFLPISQADSPRRKLREIGQFAQIFSGRAGALWGTARLMLRYGLSERCFANAGTQLQG